MRKTLLNAVLLWLLLTLSSFSLSAAESVTVIYVNGIQNTREDANDSGIKIIEILLASENHLSNKRDFNIVVVYNPTGFTSDGDVACITCQLPDDQKELFIQKTSEEHFAKDFAEILAPHNASTTIDKNAALRIKTGFVDDLTPGGNSLEQSRPRRPAAVTDASMAPNGVVIDFIVDTLKLVTGPSIVIGHSQGNLLINLAYAKLAAEVGQEVRKMLRVVNVANTSQFAISNLSLTHGADEALFSTATDKPPDISLEKLPKIKGWIRTTPRCENSDCEFVISKATFGGIENPRDAFDHEFVKTYLSTLNLPVVVDSQGVSYTQSKTRFVDRFEDLVYTAVFSLEAERDPPIPTNYSITPIGTPRPTGINDRGDIVGQCGDIACIRLATDGTWRAIGTLGGTYSNAAGINNSGTVVGESTTFPNVGSHAYRFSGIPGAPLTDIHPALMGIGESPSAATSISDVGHIVGNIYRSDGSQRAFLLFDGTARDLGTLPNHTSSLVSKVNNFGLVVGYGYSGAPIAAFISLPGAETPSPIPQLTGFPSAATSVNDSGTVIGTYFPYADNTIDYISFVYSSSTGTFTPLKDGNLYALATSINNRGEIIGTKTSGTFIYKNGVMKDLNQLIPQDSGWWLTGDGLNNNLGQIVSSAVLDGQSQYVLLTPVATARK